MYPFLALSFLAVIPSVCKGLHEKTCDVIPKDPYIEVGSDTEIVCQTSCIHGKIFWTLDNRAISGNLSKTINSSHTILSLRNFNQHSATLQCHSADTQVVLGGTTIRTYSKPNNISCILHYKDQETESLPDLFTCSWEHQIHSSLEINYTVCTSSSCSSQSEICNSHETTCTSNYFDISSKIPFDGDYNLTVRAKCAAWEAYSDHYEFTPFGIWKITQPKLSVSTSSDHPLVEWKILSRIPLSRYYCQVKYCKAVSGGTPECVLSNSREEEKMTIETVESCSNYTFVVRCALEEAPWSDWSREKTVLTKLNKSDFKPRLWRKVAEAEKNGVRKVHAMWSEIPSACQDTFTYTITQTPYKERMTGVNYTDTLCGNSICDVNQDAHRISLTVFHDEFLFVEDSVYVPAVGESVPQVTDIKTSNLEGVILVSWKAPVHPVSGYMIDYTHNGNQYYWKETKYTNTTLFDLLDKVPYNITVTPLFDDKTGHGSRALQICSRVGDPGNVTIVDVQAKDKSALVSWNMESQEACSGVVVNYSIFYSAERGPQLHVIADGAKQQIFLKDLNPHTQYSVYVKATALTGTSKSIERFFTTKRFDPRLSATLGVCGGVLIIIVLSLGLCCAIQWRKFREKPVPDPGHSSVASWSSMIHEKRICPSRPFHYPSESFCDRVYTEEAQRTSTSPLIGCNHYPASDQPEEYTDPATVTAPDVQNEVKPVETQHPPSPGESTELLSSEDSPSSPYQSQSPVETPAQRSSKQCKRFPAEQPEKTPPLTVYITLDMFAQGQDR